MTRRILIASLGALLGAWVVGWYLVPLALPLPVDWREGIREGVVFEDREGRPMRRLLAREELRIDEPARFEEFPEVLVKATLAAEDERFFTHPGIDGLAILRAIRDGLAEREIVSGASTISQQTVKIYSPPARRSIPTKIREAFLARSLELKHSKEEILAGYLNRLPYGNQFTGTRAAARGYFGKPLADLSLAEATLLAGLPNRPSQLNPWKHPEAARKRQRHILQRMRESGWIDETAFAAALVEELRYQPKGRSAFEAPHFVDLVLQERGDVIPDSGRVRTTLDLDTQRMVESAIASELAALRQTASERDELQAAVVVIENETGDVRALSGSRSFFGSEDGQVNGAWSPRSAGSTLKPFTYLVGLQEGYTAASVLSDTPVEYVTATGAYQPVNFDRRFRGPVTIRHALANSLNVPAVKLLNELGGPSVLHELMTEHLGFTSLAGEPVDYGLGLTLGNAEVRLLELTNAYACLARLGEYQPYRLLQAGGSPPAVERVSPHGQQGVVGDRPPFDSAAAWLIADILSDNSARADAFGLHSPLRLPFRVAAKTGTSTDFRDNWTIGYTPDFTVGVWVGRFNNRPLNQISGAMGAGPLFHRIMRELHRDREPRWYSEPAEIVRAPVDPLNGLRPGEGLSAKPRTILEVFTPGNLPPRSGPSDYSPDGRTRLAQTFAPWWNSEDNRLRGRAALAESSPTAVPPPFRIVSPLDGTIAFLDPDLPAAGGRFPLRIAGSGEEWIEWHSQSLQVREERGRVWAILEEGEHEIVARDRKTGREVASRFVVERM